MLTINEYLKKYNLVDTKILTYDDDTKHIITEILNGHINKYAKSKNGTTLLYIGGYYEYVKKDEHTAEQYYHLVLECDASDQCRAACNLGFLYEKQNKLDLAEKYYRLATEHNDPVAANNLGFLYEKQNKLDLAEKYYHFAIRDNNRAAINNLGFLYEKQNKLELAEKYYISAVKYGHPNAMNNLGFLYEKQNKLELAEKYYIIAVKHNNLNAMNNIGHLYVRQNKLDLATKYYLKALLFDAGIIGYIINIISKTSLETQLEILELVPEIRATDEYFHKISRTAHNLYIDKKIEFTRTLSYHLIDNLANICLEYY